VAGRLAAATVALATAAGPAAAQMTGAPSPGYRRETGQTAAAVPAPLREIGFDQRLDVPLPLDTEFADEAGRRVRLGTYFGERPVVLAFVYYDCPMLCPMIRSSIASTVSVLSLEPGRDFEVVLVSFDPRETPALAARTKAEHVAHSRSPEAAARWHFLTGETAAIERVTAAAGFRFAWDDETQQYAHPSGLVVATPDGRVARYLFGLDFGPRDLRFALVEASAGRIGSAVDSVLLYCYHYDPATGRYGFVVMRAVRLAGGATILGLGTLIFVLLRRERRAAASAER
jgi:protein SCO1/2